MFQLIINHLFFFWSPWITTIFYKISDNMHYKWSKLCQKYFQFKIKIIGENTLFQDEPCLYFTNHRSQADFFVDQILVNGRAIFISRWMVAFYFPFIPIYFFGKSLFFFSKKDKTTNIYKQLDNYKKESPYPCILVYPEGTRNILPMGLPIKNGFIRYAFNKKLPIQIFISLGKENIMSIQNKK